MSVTNQNGVIKAHCFRASCKLSIVGEANNLSKKDLKKKMSTATPYGTYMANRPVKDFSIPDTWRQVEMFDERWEWLDEHNCSEVFADTPNRFWWDELQDRLVFVQYQSNTGWKVEFASGRTLCGDEPKWYKYCHVEPFFKACTKDTKDGNRIYVCEDAPSACSLGRFGYGVSLNGTIMNYDKFCTEFSNRFAIRICLDADANKLAIDMKRQLQGRGFTDVKVLTLSDDAKYLDYDQLEKELK